MDLRSICEESERVTNTGSEWGGENRIGENLCIYISYSLDLLLGLLL